MKLTDEFKSWVGYLEKDSDYMLYDFTANAGNRNYTVFAKWYKEDYGLDFQGQPWCAMFVTECVKRAIGKDLQEKLMPHFSYCPAGVRNFQKAGRWITENPKEGDIIFFRDSSGTACHVGYVYRAENGYVYTIEGNTSSASGVEVNGGAVAKKAYDTRYSRILGYGRLNLEEIFEMLKTEELEERIAALERQNMKYNYVPDMPMWAREPITKLYNMGVLRGDGEKLNLTENVIRILCVIVRILEMQNII